MSQNIITSALPFGFDGTFLRKLDRLALVNRQTLAGPSAGPRRSFRHGTSPEFSDFRDYSPGDDFRRIDWNAYARLDRLFLRLYRAEEMTTLTLFLDHSASMQFGTPRKGFTAARIAAAFAYLALTGYDRVAVAGYADKIDHYLPPQSGKGTVPRVWKSLADVAGRTGEATDFSGLRGFARLRHNSGIAIVLSDFLTLSDWQSGLLALQSAGQEVNVIQVLAAEELNPDLHCDWRLHDVETGHEVEVTVSARLLRRYAEELAGHTASLVNFCHRHDMSFAQISSDTPVEDSVLRDLRFAGLLQ